MAQKHQVSLGETQETLLIPLYGRAMETGKQRALLPIAKRRFPERFGKYKVNRFSVGGE